MNFPDLNKVYSGTSFDQGEARPSLEKHKDEDCYILRIDNSTLEKWQTCPRAAEYYVVNRREKPGSPALRFGKHMHKALETLGLHGNTPETLQRTKEQLTQLFMEDPNPEGDHRCLEYGIAVLEKYVVKYLGETCSVVEHHGKPFVEVPFSLLLGAIEINNELAYSSQQLLGEGGDEPLYVKKLYVFWSGKIDRLVSFDGRKWIMDHKTTSMGGPTFYADFALSQQMVGYVWASREITKEPIAGAIIDALECRKITKTGKGVTFERQFYQYEEWHMDEWYHDVHSQIGSFVDQLVEGYFPKKTKWCMGKYGACPYHDVCTLPPSQRKTLLNSSLFGPVTWSPLAP
jgi:hypothetical protein